MFTANVFIKYINDTSAWIALKNEAQAKSIAKILPKIQNLNPKIVLLPWSVYYKYTNTASTKRKIDSISPENDVASSTIKDECAEGQTPEKVPRLLKG